MKGRVIIGAILAILGLFLIILDFFIRVIAPSIWGVILFVIGITIILNIDEDKIEGRKDLKSGKRGSK